ncbi:prepilin-type N-terminal cleavage/methylation domain-containing protein [Thiomicrorhabdus sp.]|uniref:type II secretion system protein n=1 Tax=Thiomicrorhabdus sp. TaxID=2039724 RepID=UPI002AA5FC03|nr:prepilin-type N-terminal cleavage/methylation domain-containing protein [Thiomicrorhabdus sp.]
MNNILWNSKKKYAVRGFSLVEVAVVLAILGVIAAGSIGVYSEQRTHVLWKEGDSRLASIKSSLLKFVKTNSYMPCPDNTIPPDGFEDRNLDATCQADTGNVPFNNLGLTAADVQDSWGNNIVYAINHNATNPVSMANCPLSSACYFNNTRPPMFDLTTLPVMGNPGVNNLRVCNGAACGPATAPANINADALIAVLVAKNENGNLPLAQLNGAEQENDNGDLYFVQSQYSKTPHYDDLLTTISANELKDRYENEIVELNRNGDPANPPPPPDNPFDGVTVDIAGGNGDDNRFSKNIGVNIESGTLKFGADNAGKTVTLTFNTKVTGGWEDADALNEGVAAERDRYGNLETQDRFIVGLNNDVNQIVYDTASATNPRDGRLDVDNIAEYMGNPNQDQYYYYDANDDRDNTWYEYASYNVALDENGDLKVDFANFSTALDEKVQVSDVKAVLYTAPTVMPDFPNAKPIDAIPETSVFKWVEPEPTTGSGSTVSSGAY